LKAELLGSYH